MSPEPSRWWYAIVPFPFLVGLRYALGWLTRVLLPTAGPTRAEALPVLLVGISASLVGALVIVTAPLFAVGMVLDVRALRVRTSWCPHWAYASLGILPLLGIFVQVLAFVSIPATIGYLARRRNRIGYPLGNGLSSDVDTERPGDTSFAGATSSGWWYGVVIPPLFELIGGMSTWGVRTTGVLRQGSDPLALLVPVGVTLLAVGFVPVFSVSLYLDAKAIGDASGETVFHPRLWGLLGLGSLIGLLVFRNTLMVPIALVYLLYRRRATGRFSAG